MKIKIVKCSHPTSWYRNRIGENFDVWGERENEYVVKEDKGEKWLVDKEDCKIINEIGSGSIIGYKAGYSLTPACDRISYTTYPALEPQNISESETLFKYTVDFYFISKYSPRTRTEVIKAKSKQEAEDKIKNKYPNITKLEFLGLENTDKVPAFEFTSNNDDWTNIENIRLVPSDEEIMKWFKEWWTKTKERHLRTGVVLQLKVTPEEAFKAGAKAAFKQMIESKANE